MNTHTHTESKKEKKRRAISDNKKNVKVKFIKLSRKLIYFL